MKSPFLRRFGMPSPFFDNETGFSPSVLFALAEPGVWYDPSDVANLNWRRNLLTWTEQFDNAAWTKFRSAVSANAAVAPDATTTAEKLIPNNGTTAGGAYNTTAITIASGSAHTASVYVKAAELGFVFVGANIRGSSTNIGLCVNLSTGARSNEGASGTYTVTDVGNGWWRITCSGTSSTTNGYIEVWPLGAAGSFDSYLGNGTSGILIWGAQLEVGSTATDYQRITDVNTEVLERFPTATLFQDTAGTTPVTTPGQTVALALDKSRGLVLGPELVTNGDFSGGLTGWTNGSTGTGTATAPSGSLVISGTDASNRGIASQGFATTVGRTYIVTFAVISGVGNSVIAASTSAGASFNLGFVESNSQNRRFYFVATSTLSYVNLYTSGSATVSLDNISVRELPGFHATQATAASRPTYGVVPRTGRRNLLTRTEEFGTAPWANITAGTGVAPTVTTDAGSDPNGLLIADRIQFSLGGGTTSGDISRRAQGFTTPAASHVFSVYLRSTDGSSTYNMHIVGPDGLTTNIVVTGSWQRFSVSANGSGSTVNYAIGLRGGQTPANSNTADVLAWGAQLETGSSATNYQRVGSAFDVTEAGVPSLSYLSFDGIDDFLVTPTITPGTDKAQVFAGVRKLSDAAVGIIYESSVNAGLNAGTIQLYNAIDLTIQGRARGSNDVSLTTSALSAAPLSFVATLQGDIAGDTSSIRVNSVSRASSTADQGTGNFLAYPLYIGRRGGTTLPFNGNIYGLIVRFGANLDANTISNTETWVNGRTGAY